MPKEPTGPARKSPPRRSTSATRADAGAHDHQPSVSNGASSAAAGAAQAAVHAPPATVTAAAPVLLSGGNPQIPKGYGDEPVQAYIAAMPGWKQQVGRHIDALIVGNVAGVRKAVKWNTPMYGVRDNEYFVSFHCFTNYIKVTFFQGAKLVPPPPVASKYPAVRYAHIDENGVVDEDLFIRWLRQASELPGERL